MQDYVLSMIKEIAAKFEIEKVVLFGSRARDDHLKTSDYDIAIFGKDISLVDQALLREAMEEINTLKKVDVVFIDEDSEKELVENI
ncbi:MAG: nucleotidyltransferase domain-containing protein [Tindallia sp. MSAO_Bac2]|nr:MAG: nucleotidyltransferase domain-containing protein [Tindallia sp. MSAO_Bac2]